MPESNGTISLSLEEATREQVLMDSNPIPNVVYIPDQDNLRDELMTLTISELIDLTLDLHKRYLTSLTQLNEMRNHFLIKKSIEGDSYPSINPGDQHDSETG